MNNCPICGAPAKRTYCSQLCHAATRRQSIEKTCPECQKNFATAPAENAIYCSLTCRRAFEARRSPWYAKIGTKAVHRIEAERKLGRTLLPGEVVHHIDGNRRNNHPDNLMVFTSQAEHIKHEIANGDSRAFPHEHYVTLGKLSVEARRAKAKHPV